MDDLLFASTFPSTDAHASLLSVSGELNRSQRPHSWVPAVPRRSPCRPAGGTTPPARTFEPGVLKLSGSAAAAVLVLAVGVAAVFPGTSAQAVVRPAVSPSATIRRRACRLPPQGQQGSTLSGRSGWRSFPGGGRFAPVDDRQALREAGRPVHRRPAGGRLQLVVDQPSLPDLHRRPARWSDV